MPAKDLDMTNISILSMLLALTASSLRAPESDVDADAVACREAEDGSRVCDFEDDDVMGSTASPEGKIVQARPVGRHASLIRIRQHFAPELVELARDL